MSALVDEPHISMVATGRANLRTAQSLLTVRAGWQGNGAQVICLQAKIPETRPVRNERLQGTGNRTERERQQGSYGVEAQFDKKHHLKDPTGKCPDLAGE
jgi:hypothetical protein